MRTLLGIFLALNGVVIWALTATATLLLGLGLATSPGAWEEMPLSMKLAALPVIFIFLGVGHLMILFGRALDPLIKFATPEENQIQWFTFNILRQVALVLMIPSAVGLITHSLASTTPFFPAGVLCAVATTVLALLVFYLTRVLDRFP